MGAVEAIQRRHSIVHAKYQLQNQIKLLRDDPNVVGAKKDHKLLELQ
jgi:hypothetical protein